MIILAHLGRMSMVHKTGLQADALGAQLVEATAAAEGHKASRLALKAAESAKTEAGPFLMHAIWSSLTRLLYPYAIM